MEAAGGDSNFGVVGGEGAIVQSGRRTYDQTGGKMNGRTADVSKRVIQKRLERVREHLKDQVLTESRDKDTLAEYIAMNCDSYIQFEACCFQVIAHKADVMFPHKKLPLPTFIEGIDETLREMKKRKELLDKADYDTFTKKGE